MIQIWSAIFFKEIVDSSGATGKRSIIINYNEAVFYNLSI
jgi:hypothetical protein